MLELIVILAALDAWILWQTGIGPGEEGIMSEGNAAERMRSRWPKGMTLGDMDKKIKAGRMCARCLKAGPTKEARCSCGELSANVCADCEGAEDLFSPCEDDWA